MTKEVMQQALEALNDLTCTERTYIDVEKGELAIKALEEALNQEQGEQLAILGWQEIDCPICGGGARAFPKQEQSEPVAWMQEGQPELYVKEEKDEKRGYVIPLYTTPQTKEWAGLTKAELIKCGVLPFGMSYELYQAIEAKLKDKNT